MGTRDAIGSPAVRSLLTYDIPTPNPAHIPKPPSTPPCSHATQAPAAAADVAARGVKRRNASKGRTVPRRVSRGHGHSFVNLAAAPICPPRSLPGAGLDFNDRDERVSSVPQLLPKSANGTGTGTGTCTGTCTDTPLVSQSVRRQSSVP